MASQVRRIDFFSCPFDQYGAAMLTYTGSDITNRSMRNWASKIGYGPGRLGAVKRS